MLVSLRLGALHRELVLPHCLCCNWLELTKHTTADQTIQSHESPMSWGYQLDNAGVAMTLQIGHGADPQMLCSARQTSGDGGAFCVHQVLYLGVRVVSQSQAARSNVPNSRSSQDPHNLGSAAAIVRDWQDMSHPGSQLPQVPCTSRHANDLDLTNIH